MTTEHPIPLAEVMTILLFSVIWNALRTFLPGLLSTRSSIVSGTESLISLHKIRPSTQQSVILALQTSTWAVWYNGRRTSALVKQLHGVGRNRQEMPDILVAR